MGFRFFVFCSFLGGQLSFWLSSGVRHKLVDFGISDIYLAYEVDRRSCPCSAGHTTPVVASQDTHVYMYMRFEMSGNHEKYTSLS